MQLLSYGVEDLYLTGDPKMTYFVKKIEKFHPFMIDVVEIPVSAPEGLNKGGREYVCHIPQGAADMIIDSHLVLRWENCVKFLPNDSIHGVIDYVELNAGGQTISRWTGDFLTQWEEITNEPKSHSVNDYLSGKSLSYDGGSTDSIRRGGEFMFRIPMFGEGIERAFPLCAMRYHTLQFRIGTHAMIENVTPPTAAVRIRGGYLDGIHRDYFSMRRLTYVFPQLQLQRIYFEKSNLYFRNPVFAFLLIIRDASETEMKFHDSVTKFEVYLNGEKYFSNEKIFDVYEKATNFSRYFGRWQFISRTISNKFVPDGYINLSRFGKIESVITTDGTEGDSAHVKLYAMNYGVAVIHNGMIGLPFT